MEGYHGTVFAYGMTGTGKTFSMQGTATNPGVIPLAITDIFSFIRETPHREFLLRVSYLEIYNEKIHDLLAINSTGINGLQAPLEEIKLREDSKRGVYATPLKEEIVQSPTQLLRVIARGDNARRTAGTQWNARSSRSHAVVQIVVESRERQPGNASMAESKRQALLPGGVRVSTLSLIDLAGSEKAADTAERRKEGSHINKSLLTLGTVIANLSGDKEKPGAKDGKHLPYRDSKLTRLLQPALSGNSLVSILCTIQIGSAGSVATAQAHTGETLNTMKFASRAKNNIVSHAKKAEEAFGGSGAAAALLDRYRLEIADLRKQLDEVKGENAHGTPAKWSSSKSELKEEKDEEKEEEPLSIEAEKERDKARELEQEQRHEEQMLEMQLARTALKERIEHLNRLILSSKSVGVNYSANRSYSSLSLQRTSVASNGENYSTSRSQRSSAATLEAAKSPTGSSMGLNRNGSAASMRSLRGIRDSSMTTSTTGHHIPETGSEEDVDTFDENGDGQASLNVQVRALQSDLADKNRYIGTLEKRLLQARRSSSSRVSMGFSARHTRDLSADGEGGGVEQVLKEKDAEIAELRARLDDKDRMVTALRSAARKRDVADLAVDTGVNGEGINGLSRGSSGRSPIGRSPSSQSQNATSPHPGMSRVASGGSSHSFGLSPVARDRGDREGGPNHKSVDSVTKMLDEMIKQRVRGEAESHSHSNSPHAQRNSHEKIVEESESAAEEQATTGARKPSTSSEKDRIDSGIGVKSPTTKTSRRSSSVRVVSP